jgi:hypothetical protein
MDSAPASWIHRPMFTVDNAAKFAVNALGGQLEAALDADVLAILGPLFPGLDRRVLRAAESLLDDKKRSKLAVVLSTGGGVVETVEQIAQIFRHHWSEVIFIIPDRAMSAGTVLAMSGDAILMDYASVLGPIDPQVVRGGKLVPALSYLTQFDRIMQKFEKGSATAADVTLLDRFDLAELHQFEEARELSVSLLERWLAKYKFKDWTETETTKKKVDDAMRQQRANEIGLQLCDHQHWHSHGRGLSMAVLRQDLNLKIDDFGADPQLRALVHDYHGFIEDYMAANKIDGVAWLHTRNYF